MGSRSSKSSLKPLVKLIFGSHQLKLYIIPETFQEFETMAYNFYYAYADTFTSFETLVFSYTSRGFLRHRSEINSKKTYKNAFRSLTNDPLHITIQVEKNDWIYNLEFNETQENDLENAIHAAKETICECEDLVELHIAYSKLLKISNQFCEYITAHDMKSGLFGVLMVIISDSCKVEVTQRFEIIENIPYIKFKSEVLSENSLDVLRVWNDFMYYLNQGLKKINDLYNYFQGILNFIQGNEVKPKIGQKDLKNYEITVKSIELVKSIRERLEYMEESIKEYTINLQKPQVIGHMAQISAIISSCAGYGIENLMSIFSISPINKYPFSK